MQELQQLQSRPKPREKSVWPPLVLLIIPAITFLIFLLSSSTVFASLRGTLAFSAQPAWLHFCLTHHRLLSRMFAVGLLCSVPNSLVTLVWSRREKPRHQAHRTEGIAPTALYVGGGYLLVALLMAAAYLCKVFQGPQSLTHSPILDGPVADGILGMGALMLIVSLMGLVVTTSLTTMFELFARLKRRDRLSDV